METPLWIQVWEQKAVHIALFAAFLMCIVIVMVYKDRIAKNRTMMNVISYVIPAVSFLYVGLVLKAQPTTTNLIIPLASLRELQFPLGLFLLEPYIFISFVFIVITMLLWGRGVFCGWLCPYGAMTELLSRIYRKLLPGRGAALPETLHRKLLYLKYIVFLVIAGVSFYSFMLSEYLTEIEPFRTFVLQLQREWYFVAYFAVLTLGSTVLYRAFCRYLCPLGAALALPSLLKKLPLIKLKRYDFCTSCRICGRSCDPQAISANGLIIERECFACMDCQVNFWDEDICPVLRRQKGKGGAV